MEAPELVAFHPSVPDAPLRAVSYGVRPARIPAHSRIQHQTKGQGISADFSKPRTSTFCRPILQRTKPQLKPRPVRRCRLSTAQLAPLSRLVQISHFGKIQSLKKTIPHIWLPG